MTNTNDFRRYSYSSDASYAIKAFDVQRGSQAPKLNPEGEKSFKVRENKVVKSKSQIVKEQKKAFVKSAKIAVVAVTMLLLAAVTVNSFVQKNELTRQISQTQTDISNAESEYVSLQSRLNSLVSMSMIDEYAVEELGMTKVKSNQIQYIDVESYKAQRQKKLSEQSPAATAKQLNNKAADSSGIKNN